MEQQVDSFENPKGLELETFIHELNKTDVMNIQLSLLQDLMMWTNGKSHIYDEINEKIKSLQKELNNETTRN